jgi:hypothetical protein
MKGGSVKKFVRFILLSAVLVLAAQGNAGAYPFCGYPPPCAFVYDDCMAFNGNWYSEFINYCVDSSSGVHELYSYSCTGRGLFQQGSCYV